MPVLFKTANVGSHQLIFLHQIHTRYIFLHQIYNPSTKNMEKPMSERSVINNKYEKKFNQVSSQLQSEVVQATDKFTQWELGQGQEEMPNNGAEKHGVSVGLFLYFAFPPWTRCHRVQLGPLSLASKLDNPFIIFIGSNLRLEWKGAFHQEILHSLMFSSSNEILMKWMHSKSMKHTGIVITLNIWFLAFLKTEWSMANWLPISFSQQGRQYNNSA